MKYDVLIIGYGTVGNNLYCDLEDLPIISVVDKYKDIAWDVLPKYDIGFVCVDTPLNGEELDITEVRNAIAENDCDIYVIKSTVPVGTTELLKKETGKRIVFSPEYYGGTQHCNNYEFDFTILGGDKNDCIEVQNYLQETYDARHEFHLVDSKTAEMVKFMENSWIGTKVTFCNEFYRACEREGISYEEVRELFIADPRVSPSHTFVYRKHPYYDSHCLNKDIPAIAYGSNIELLKDIIQINEKNKKY